MLRNYIIIAWRNMARNKVNSFINVAGLAIGMACVILILLFIKDESSYDRFFKESGRIYQVNLDANFSGQPFYTSNTPPPVGSALMQSFPEIKSYTRFYAMGDAVIASREPNKAPTQFTEKKMLAVDSNFLEIFDYSFKEGNARSCLQIPHSIVITASIAKKYFGNTEVLGKTLVLDQYNEPFMVTAVLNDIPSQSSIRFDMLIPVAAFPLVRRFSWSWVWCQMNTYVLLSDNVGSDKGSIQKLESKFPAMVRQKAANAFKRIGQPLDEFYKKGGKWDFHLQPITDLHLHSATVNSEYYTTKSDIKYVYIFFTVALFIIVLACVNFMNLSTAQSAGRAKEVGIRKVLGSLKGQLIKQFLTEAALHSFFAVFIALLLVKLLLPAFNQVAGKTLGFAAIFTSCIWIFILVLFTLTGLLAGSYPAFYITSFNPVAVLKGSGLFKKSLSHLFIRNGLVVFQFTVSIVLIICTLLVFMQLEFTQRMDLGLRKENVVVIPHVEKMKLPEQETFRQELSKIPGVVRASLSSSVPTKNYFTDVYIPDARNVAEPLATDISVSSFIVDENFIPTLKIQILKGRNFSGNFADSGSVIVNEAMIKQVGWKEPIGKSITYTGHNDQKFNVVGVVKDFNMESLRTSVVPFALFHWSSQTYGIGTTYILASIQSTNPAGTLGQIETKWKSFAPAVSFEHSFLDKDFDSLYQSEQRMGYLLGVFTFLSIVVAALGLFGLSVYTAQRRNKEIGIRKVLGASIQNVVTLLSKEFLKLVTVAALIAFPIAWWAMNKWLHDFVYRVSIGWQVFVLSGLGALLVALVTVSFQAWKAAIMNPVKSLRSE